MPGPNLTGEQQRIVRSPLDAKIFISGPAGTGKTTAGVCRLQHLLAEGADGNQILVLTPQRSLQARYLVAMHSPQRPAGGEVATATIGGLARRLCELFWPLAARAAGFAFPEQPPTFLTLETSQYYMARLVRPYVDSGHFGAVTIDRNRLYSQIIDNLNKSAVVGFPYAEIGMRLAEAYQGEPTYRRVFAEAQECATHFRAFCLAHNLLDFSLQLETFLAHLWPQPLVREYVFRTYRHLIYDNVEEDVPRAHDLVGDWLKFLDSALLIYDTGGGFRRFLGADPETGLALSDLCEARATLHEDHVMAAGIAAVEKGLRAAVEGDLTPGQPAPMVRSPQEDRGAVLSIVSARFYPELLQGIAETVHSMIATEGVPAAEIAIVAPYVSDALRFALTRRLDELGVPWQSIRPSRSLRDEPASRALVTLAALAHPHWNIRPPRVDVGQALMICIEGLDLIRAQLLAEIVYREKEFRLSSFAEIRPEVRNRIGEAFGARYESLREWVGSYRTSAPLPLDHFLRRLFGEVLSQPGFAFHRDLDGVRVASMLVESARKFRVAMQPGDAGGEEQHFDVGREYLQLLDDGVIAASYTTWTSPGLDAVLVAPAHAYLMMNRPVSVQVWLDIGSTGWYERIAQPLTHPYVLSRSWEAGRPWLDSDETRTADESLARVVSGLVRRCRERIVVGISELGETGYEQRGTLLRAVQTLLVTGWPDG